MLSKITSKGQITIPKAIRDYLDLHSGDKVEFMIDNKGRVVLTPKTLDIDDLFGSVTTTKRLSIDEIDQVIKKRIKKKFKK